MKVYIDEEDVNVLRYFYDYAKSTMDMDDMAKRIKRMIDEVEK